MLIPNILFFSEIPISHSLFHSLLEGKNFLLSNFPLKNEKVEKARMKKAEEKSSLLKYVIYGKICMKKMRHYLK